MSLDLNKRGKKMEMENALILKNSLQALCNIAGRRTSENFANKVMNTIMSSLKERYTFLDFVRFNDAKSNDIIEVSSQINSIDSSEIFKAIETAIRIVHLDLQDKGGLFFMKEFKQLAGIETVIIMEQNGVDLSILEMEQKHTYLQHKNRNKVAGDVSLLGYSWSDVSNWKYDDHNKVCILYSKEEKILDKLNLDAIIKEHIDKLSGSDDLSELEDIKTERYQKEYELLNLLRSKDVDIETAMIKLQVDEEELEHMVKRLIDLGFLEYADVDVVKISEKGMQYISRPVES